MGDSGNRVQTLGYSNKTFFYTSAERGTFILRDHYVFHEDIDPESMREAIDEALMLYPEFKISVFYKNGEFVSVRNDRPVAFFEGLEQEHRIGGEETNGYLFYAAYEGKTLMFSFFHGLSDRKGLLSFVGSVLYRYAVKTGVEMSKEEIDDQKDRIRFSEEDIPADLEKQLDPYGVCADESVEGKDLYQCPGAVGFGFDEYPDESMELNRYLIEFSYTALLRKIMRARVSAGSFLIYLATRAFYETNPLRPDRPLIAMLPVDFRNRLGVETEVNCSDGILIPVSSEDFRLPWQDLCIKIQDHMKTQVCRENFVKIVTDKVNMIRRFESKNAFDIIEQINTLPGPDGYRPFTIPVTFPGSMSLGKGIDKMLEDTFCFTFARATFIHGYTWNDSFRLDVAIRSDDGSWAEHMVQILKELDVPVTIKAFGRTKGDWLPIQTYTDSKDE